MEINSNKCIIVYLDVLGYADWVKSVTSGEQIFQIFNGVSFKHELFKEQSEEFMAGFRDALRLYIIADSIIVAFDLDKCPDATSIFLDYVALFICEFISKTGFLIRGGLGYGDLVIRNILDNANNKFIFGKTYVCIVELEKRAVYPKILVDDAFVTHFTGIFNKDTLKYYYLQKCWGQWTFDYYYKLDKFYNIFLTRKILQSIKEKIQEIFHAGEARFEQKVKEKYYYFRDYHNAWVRKIFRAKLLEKDFVSLNMKKADVVKPLEYLGVLESCAEFYIKEDVALDLGRLVQRVNCEFKHKSQEVANILKEQIEANQKDRENILIEIE